MALHPPKTETFDVAARSNVDPKGFRRPVDLYRETPAGLYMARPMVDHPTIRYVRSWLLPALGLRVTDFTWHPGHERRQDFYLDVGDVHPGARCWTTEDHYLDLVVHTGADTEVIDVDEYVEAVAAGLLPQPAAERAFATAVGTHGGLAAHGHDLDAWLATRGVHLDWPAEGTLSGG